MHEKVILKRFGAEYKYTPHFYDDHFLKSLKTLCHCSFTSLLQSALCWSINQLKIIEDCDCDVTM